MSENPDAPIRELLGDAFDRVTQTLHTCLDGLSGEGLTWRPGPDANTVAWLSWHLTRVQDDHLTSLARTLDLDDREQVWTGEGYCSKFGLPFDPAAHGYGQSSEDVAAVRTPAPDLLAYHDAVAARTKELLDRLTTAQLATVVDENWDPPVTAASRLISVVNDTTQHVGQVAYVCGLWNNRVG